MNDFISRKEAIESLSQHSFENGYDYDKTVELLSDLSAHDVAPVVHGHWEEVRMGGRVVALTCSVCKNDDNPSIVPGRFCWQCGAKMDGDANG